MLDASLCQLGGSAPNPVLTTLKYFRDEYQAHIEHKRCPAGVCKAWSATASCRQVHGCLACLKPCPAAAITGERKKVHVLDQAKCIKCGICFEVCRFDAVEVA